jgi:hypothetical protein
LHAKKHYQKTALLRNDSITAPAQQNHIKQNRPENPVSKPVCCRQSAST